MHVFRTSSQTVYLTGVVEDSLSCIQVSPVPVTCQEEGLLPKSTLEAKHAKQSFANDFAHLPVGSIPLIATSCITYQDTLKRVALTTNRVYREFLESEEGQDFNGQVCAFRGLHGRWGLHAEEFPLFLDLFKTRF